MKIVKQNTIHLETLGEQDEDDEDPMETIIMETEEEAVSDSELDITNGDRTLTVPLDVSINIPLEVKYMLSAEEEMRKKGA
jgi:hypothetical protein